MKILSIIITIIFAAVSLSAQPREGKNVELSLSGSYQNYSSGSSSGSSGAFLISPRAGFFLINGLELEPELLFMVASGSDPAYVLNGNVSYNFLTDKNSVPFILVGYGIANTTPFFNVPFGKTDFKVGVLNIGAGAKIFIGKDVALRIEYRFQKFSGQEEKNYYSYYSYTNKVDTRIHSVQFGFSVLL